MKVVIILSTLLAVVLAIQGDTYNIDLENFDIEELLTNGRLLESYGKCFLFKGPCTPQGKDIRGLMPEALRTNCAKCTPKQRQMIRRVARTFRAKLPTMWDALTQQEDPIREYRKSFDDFLNSTD